MILSITAVLVPVLLLLSIRTGVIGQMQDELRSSPKARELVTVGEPVVSPALIRELRRDRSVAFVAPRTRLLSASAVVRTADLSRGVELDMVPSGPGDPLVTVPWRGGMVALSEAAARKLAVSAGDVVLLIVDRRTRDGADQQARLRLRVAAVVDYRTSRNSLAVAYLPHRWVEAAERWREDPAAVDLSAAAQANAVVRQRSYSGLRLYARSVDDVIGLRSKLLRNGIETESRAGDIRLVQRLEQSMSIFIASLALLMTIGLVLALGAIQWGWVERKRFDYSYLRLLGMNRRELAALPVVQALMLVVPAATLAIALAALAQAVINRLFLGQLGDLRGISRMEPLETSLLVLATFGVAGFGAFFAARSAARISPIVALRGN
jgi:putative ABC transport system permease protein